MRAHFGADGGRSSGSTGMSGRDYFHCATRAEAARSHGTVASRPASCTALVFRYMFSELFSGTLCAVRSEANKHTLRRARSRAKLIDATIAMIAEQGFPGFT